MINKMTDQTSKSDQETRFDTGAWLVLTIALALLILSAAQLAYRFTLPTDGWSVYTEDVADLAGTWILYANLVGEPSGVQAGDKLLAVSGVSVQNKATTEFLSPPPDWQVGRRATYLILRGDQQMSVAVPIVHWNARALWSYNLGSMDKAGNVIGTLLLVVVAWFTFFRRPRLPSARALLLFSTAMGAGFISGILPDGLSVQFNQLAFYVTSFFSYIIIGTFLAPALLTFTLLFPKPKRALQKHPWLVSAPFLYGLFLLIFFAFGGNGILGWISTLGMLLLSILSLVHSGFTQRDAISRAQLRWAIGSFVLGVGLFMLNFPTAFRWVTEPALVSALLFLSNLGFAVIGIGFSVAILRYRLFDIDIIIRRTLQYTLLTGLLALGYFGSVVLLQSLFSAFGAESSSVVIVLSTLGIAALFNPLRKRIQDIIDRRFYRQKYDAEHSLAQFAVIARDEVDLQALAASLLGVVQETMQPDKTSLWIRKSNE